MVSEQSPANKDDTSKKDGSSQGGLFRTRTKMFSDGKQKVERAQCTSEHGSDETTPMQTDSELNSPKASP